MKDLTIKDLAQKESKFLSGHRACAGCAFPIIVKTILASTDKKIVVCAATGCLEVVSTVYPYSAWNVPFIHNAFENAGATISGIESAFKALKKKNPSLKKEDIKFIAFAGDGGSYDIGLQSLSGALERGHDILFVVYDNEAYMNTGIQRSSSTPFGTATTTTPDGKIHHGKEEIKKNLMEIVIAHNISYAAQAAVHDLEDLSRKAKKAFETKGPTFLNVLSPCNLGWKHPPNMTITISKLATETNIWPLYEYENGNYKINYQPPADKKVESYLRLQGRFKHLFKPENKLLLEKIQDYTNKEFEKLKKLTKLN